MEADRHQLRLRKKTLQSVLEQCQRALDELHDADPNPNPTAVEEKHEEEAKKKTGGDCAPDSPTDADYDTDEVIYLRFQILLIKFNFFECFLLDFWVHW